MGNEVDFMVHGYVQLNIFGHEVWLTTTHVCLLIVSLFILLIGLIVNRKMKHATEVPDLVQNIAELYVEMMDGVVESSMFRHWRKYANYILTIFMFLLISNISGLFGLRPPTADYGTTLSLALVTFVLIQFNAFRWKGVGGYLKDLMDPIPLFLPINIISEFATPVSLSLRLFGNVMAGTIMLALYYGMLPTIATVAIPSVLHAYLDLFSGAIQAYVFCMLTMTFVNQKLPE
jgi:F-type H+-transporting ATPase subunit a